MPPKADTEKKSPLLKREKEQQKKEAKKKENKKLKKEIEKSELLIPKPNSMSAQLKAEVASSRWQSFSAASSKPPEDVEEYVVEKMTTEYEDPKVDVPEPIDERIYEDVKEPLPPTAQTTFKKPSPPLSVTSMSTRSPATSSPHSGILSPPGKVLDCKLSSPPVAEPPRFQSVSPSNVKIRTTDITVSSISMPKPPSSAKPVRMTTSSTTATTSSTTSTSNEMTATSSTTSSSSLKAACVQASHNFCFEQAVENGQAVTVTRTSTTPF